MIDGKKLDTPLRAFAITEKNKMRRQFVIGRLDFSNLHIYRNWDLKPNFFAHYENTVHTL